MKTKQKNMELKFIILSLMAIPLIQAAHIQLIDITPEEAQKLITQQSLNIGYSNKLSETPATGKTYNGKVIDNNDYTEEVYEANQFHGQDGLGRFIFGHADNQQARLEAGNANGEVRGQYRYIDPWGKDIEVQYWSDSLGFHQSDNRPKFDLQPVTETPEVLAAREEHEKLWKEAARQSGIDVDSNGFYHTENDDLDGELSTQHQKFARYPMLSYDKHINSENSNDFGKIRDDSVTVEAQVGRSKRGRGRFIRQHDNNVEEVTSEPRGFFYSFDYPVYHIADRSGKSSLRSNEVQDKVDIYARVEEEDSEGAESRISAKIASGLAPQDEVHDVQVNPKQRLAVESANKGRIGIGLSPIEDVRDPMDFSDIPKQERISDKISVGILPEDEVHDVQTHPKQKVSSTNNLQSQRISTRIRDGLAPEDEVHDVQVSPKQKVYRSINQVRGSIKYKHTV